MTVLRKSDAQLDAEAEALILRGGIIDLRWLIIDLRRAFLYGDDVPDRIHQRYTSKSPDDEVDAKGWPMDTDEGGVGLPFSAKMHRYLRTNAGRSSSHQWDTGPDPRMRPAMASIADYSERCHARHTSHVRPGYSRSLCAEMLFQVGYLGQEPDDLAWLHGLPLEQVEKMLAEGLRHAREWRIDAEQRLSRQPGTIAPMPERRPMVKLGY